MGGGIVYISTSAIRVRNCFFYGNSSSDNLGGGLGIENCTDIQIDSCVFEANKGCGLCFDIVRRYAVNGCVFKNNTAIEGAGIYLGGCDSGIIENSVFTGNAADYFGGALSVAAKTTDIQNCLIQGNSALYNGSAFFSNGSLLHFSKDIIRNNTAADSVNVCAFFAVPLCVIDSSSINNNGGRGALYFQGCDSISIHNSDIFNNNLGILVDTSLSIPVRPVDARYNWWGTETGPFHPSQNPGGMGDSVSDHVAFAPWKLQAKIYGEQQREKNMRVRVRCIGNMLEVRLPLSAAGYDKNAVVSIFDLRGRLLFKQRAYGRSAFSIPLGNIGANQGALPCGIYCVYIKCGTDTFYTAIRFF